VTVRLVVIGGRLAAGAAVLLCTGAAVPAFAQIPQTFTNLQVLPKDIARGELVATMRGFASSLGVRCTHCHVGPDNLQGMDFATDEKDTKKTARLMLRMVQTINADYVSKVPDASARRQVGCITCHRAAEKPPRQLDEIVHTEIVARGVPAGLAVYETYRTDFFGSGLYDFRERTLNIVGTRLREGKRNEDAAAIFKANLERFPNSGVALVTLGQLAVEKGDRAEAETMFKRAIAADPANGFARQLLEKLTSPAPKPPE
jgi:hypothetical protein